MAAGTSPEGTFLQLKDGRFVDDRWVGGRWDLSKFRNAAGETDWDLVIDAGQWAAGTAVWVVGAASWVWVQGRGSQGALCRLCAGLMQAPGRAFGVLDNHRHHSLLACALWTTTRGQTGCAGHGSFKLYLAGMGHVCW